MYFGGHQYTWAGLLKFHVCERDVAYVRVPFSAFSLRSVRLSFIQSVFCIL